MRKVRKRTENYIFRIPFCRRISSKRTKNSRKNNKIFIEIVWKCKNSVIVIYIFTWYHVYSVK